MLRGGTLLQAGPVKQAMGVEGVVDMFATFGVERVANGRGARFDVFLGRTNLGDGFAVFLCEVFKHLLTAWRHLGVELEGLEMNLNRNRVTDVF